MRIWRIVRRSHAATAYEGTGSDRDDARWHRAGHRMVYASLEASGAILEKAVQVGRISWLQDHVLVPADVPDRLVRDTPTRLPRDWDAAIASAGTKDLGTKWLQAQSSVALRVPSTLSPATNALLNPLHPDADQLNVGRPVEVSPRVLRL